MIVAVIGAVALGVVALHRGETINALWIVVAAVCVYLIAYRVYAMFIARRVLQIDRRGERRRSGTMTASIMCPGQERSVRAPFRGHCGRGTVRRPGAGAAQMGYLPARSGCWSASSSRARCRISSSSSSHPTRRQVAGRADPRRDGPIPGIIAMIGILAIMIILLAVLALVVVKALADSPWGTFTVFATMPVAVLMGLYGRYIRPGRIGEVSVIGFVGLMLAIVLGEHVASGPWADAFTFSGEAWP
jgi:carbon starvation protein